MTNYGQQGEPSHWPPPLIFSAGAMLAAADRTTMWDDDNDAMRT